MKSVPLHHALALAGFLLAIGVQVPQIARLIQRKSSQDISLATQVLCLAMILCAGAVVPLTNGSPLVLANYIVSFAAVAMVLILAVYYRIRPGGRR